MKIHDDNVQNYVRNKMKDTSLYHSAYAVKDILGRIHKIGQLWVAVVCFCCCFVLSIVVYNTAGTRGWRWLEYCSEAVFVITLLGTPFLLLCVFWARHKNTHAPEDWDCVTEGILRDAESFEKLFGRGRLQYRSFLHGASSPVRRRLQYYAQAARCSKVSPESLRSAFDLVIAFSGVAPDKVYEMVYNEALSQPDLPVRPTYK